MKIVREIAVILLYFGFAAHYSVVIALFAIGERMPTMMDVLVILANLIIISSLVIMSKIQKLKS